MRRAGSLLLGFAACFVLGAAPAMADTPNCPRTLVAQVAAGDPGNATVAWVEECIFGTSDVVASSSTAPGIFPAATVVSPPGTGLQLLGNVVSDAAGDTWIFGTSNRIVYGPKATQQVEITGRWVAFRPAGGSFSTTTLPIAMLQTAVAVSRTGRIVVAWITSNGDTAIATADPSATFSMLPVQRGFQVSSVGINAAGTITLAGLPRTPSAGAYRWIEVLTQSVPNGGFAKTIVDRLVRPRYGCGRHGPPPSAGGVKLAVAPSGAALLAWTVLMARCPLARSTGMVAARPAGGQSFGRGARFSADLASYGFTGGVAVDDSGHGLVGWQRRNSHVAVDLVDPQGHPAPRATDLGRGGGGGAHAGERRRRGRRDIVAYLSNGARLSLTPARRPPVSAPRSRSAATTATAARSRSTRRAPR